MDKIVSEKRGWVSLHQPNLQERVIAFLIHVDEATHTNALSSTLALGRQEGIAAYDAAYLELALRLKLPIATLDTRLAEAATRCGVELVVVDEETPETD
jgi:predicted nucleic acid-binding protein